MECEKKGTEVALSVATDGANPVAVVAASVSPHLMMEEKMEILRQHREPLVSPEHKKRKRKPIGQNISVRFLPVPPA